MSDLPVEQTWMVLVELLTDLKKRDIDIPHQVTKNIRLAKTLINFYKTDPTNPEVIKEVGRIDEFLNLAQDNLLNLAGNVSLNYKEKWLEKLKRAGIGEELHKLKEEKSRFFVGAPPGFSLVRVSLREALAEDRVQEIAEECNVIIEFEEDDVIVIYGDKDCIKKSLKEVSSFFKEHQ